MNKSTALTTQPKGLRLWPGIVIMALYWANIQISNWIWPGEMIQIQMMMFGGMICLALFLIWWVFFSRIPWMDRIGILVACVTIGAIANWLAHPSYKNGFFFFFAPPVVMSVWVGWLLISQKLSWTSRRAGLIFAFLITFGVYTLIRHEGTDGYFAQKLALRWTPTAEEEYLARSGHSNKSETTVANESAKSLSLQPGDWSGFRGPNRDSRLTGVLINTNWNEKPPRELWRHDVGPGWSSFCVVGDHVFTQEQHDKREAVVCYHAETGKLIWAHHDDDRFWEAIGGTGPRATPTFHEGKLYTMGARGRLNCLDAATGKVIWTRSIVDDTKAAVPIWGFACSPLITDGMVIVFSGGPDPKGQSAENVAQNKSIQAYRADTGDKVWDSANSKLSYGSLQQCKLCGVEQLLFVGGDGLTSLDPKTGQQLWHYEWDIGEGFNRCTQPTVINDTDVLIGSGFGKGTRRLHVSGTADSWHVAQVWDSRAISPYFNDMVISNGHAYGFDTNGILTCVDLNDGRRKWKSRGYDNGQVLLLADQNVLLVQCEKGQVALVAAKPDSHEELARIPGLDSKTWNHPVIANGKLFIRNDQSAVCFQLPMAEKSN